MSQDFSQYRKGDVIRLIETVEVVNASGSNCLVVRSVNSFSEPYALVPSVDVRVEMVKRAARPKPKAGDVHTGAEIGKIQWKRGTTIRCVRGASGKYVGNSLPALVLFADGKWHDVGGFSSYEFDDLQRDAGFEILLVA